MARQGGKWRVTWRAVGLGGVLLAAFGMLAPGRAGLCVWVGLAVAGVALWPRRTRTLRVPAIPLRRKLLFAGVVVGGVLLGAEVLLRAIGYQGDPGHRAVLDIYGAAPRPFSRSSAADGRAQFRVSDRAFRPAELACPKPAGEVRVFCFGGSTTFGYGLKAEEAYPARLKQILRQAQPGAHVRTVNLGCDALESFRILGMMTGVLREQQPDVVVLHTGHNDFINASRITAVAELAQLSRSAVRQRLAAYRALSHSRLFRLVEHGLWAAQRRADFVTREAYSRSRWALFQQAATAYEANVRAMVQRAREAGVPIVLCTVVSVARDAPPFASVSRPGLTHAQRTEFLRHTSEMRHLTMRQQLVEAEKAGRLAVQIDPGHAQTLYDLGLVLLQQGNAAEARMYLHWARDHDASGCRAPSRVNRSLRRLARDQGLPLADIERAFQARSRFGIVDHRLFVDSIHPRPEGHQLMAEVIAGAILKSKLLRPRP